MTLRGPLAAVVLLLVAACPRAVRAADAPPAPAPAPAPAPQPAPVPEATATARAAAVRAALARPSAADAYKFEADIWLDASRFGTAVYELVPGGTEAAPRWEAHERATVEGGPSAQVHDTTATLDRELRLVRYDRTIRVGGTTAKTTRAEWTETRELRVVRTENGGPETSTTLDADPDATATVAGLLLFLRRCPAEPAVYELPLFAHESGAVEVGRVEVRGRGVFRFRDVALDAFVANVTVSGFDLEVYLSPAERAPLAVRQPRREVTFVAKALAPSEDVEAIDTARPAASAREAVARVALGRVSGDLALVEAVVHWPTYAAEERARTGADVDEARLRASVLELLRVAAHGTPRPKADALVRVATERAVETKDGDDVVVRLGYPCDDVVCRAREVDGAWRVVGFGASR
ncbi:MAG: hypothetical protein IT460_05935 [Planctomycetes bacterium]|nr:hypothetical protein [Planctomycetota bacterium]